MRNDLNAIDELLKRLNDKLDVITKRGDKR